MAVSIARPMGHQEAQFENPGTVMRIPSPYFAPPQASGMREPGTNLITIITAKGPHTTENPGVTGGSLVGPGSNMAVGSVPPLTRKGG